MKILALEASTKLCSVAIWSEGEIIYQQATPTPQAHARWLLPMVDAALKNTHLKLEQLDLLAFGRGPGAFTGLRIATAVAQGLALGWNKPILGINSLEALVWQANDQHKITGAIIALLDARMGELYGAVFLDGECVSPPQTLKPSQLETWVEIYHPGLIVGDLGEHISAVQHLCVSYLPAQPEAAAVAALAAKYHSQARTVTEVVPVPLYVRDEVAEKPIRRV
jgi:tRNA threonylcarbamoyladenosine biosynthesis protein TsaB